MIENKDSKKTKYFFTVMCIFLALAAGAVTVKRIFVGFDVDEQYALTLVYRIAIGDIPVKEMWEPHQFSALVLAIPLRIFMMITGGTEYALVFMRSLGTCILACTCAAWFLSFRKVCGNTAALISASFIFFLLPKYIIMPEFANMQIWILCLMCISVCAALRSKKAAAYLFSGLFFALLSLDYPSCILVGIVLIVLFRKNIKGLVIFILTVIVIFISILIYLRANMSFDDMLRYVGYILADNSHSQSFGEKALGYLSEIPGTLLYMIIYAAIAFVIAAAITFIKSGKASIKSEIRSGGFWITFALIWTAVSFIDQIRFWLVLHCPIVHPQYRILVLYISGVIVYFASKDEFRAKWKTAFTVIYICSAVGFLSILMLTNLDLKSTFVHLAAGCALALLMMADTAESGHARIMSRICLNAVLLVGVFSQIWLLRINNEGGYEDILLVRQKALYGPAKKVYCEYVDGYESNNKYVFLKENVPDGSKVLYLGINSVTYLFGDYEVCSPSTISTPYFDDRVMAYFSANPEKYPEYIFVEKGSWSNDALFSDTFLEWLDKVTDRNSITESKYLTIIRTRSN